MEVSDIFTDKLFTVDKVIIMLSSYKECYSSRDMQGNQFAKIAINLSADYSYLTDIATDNIDDVNSDNCNDETRVRLLTLTK